VFCADTHLADGAWSSRPAISGDSYYSLEQIVDYCIHNNLPLVIGGDVLDVKRNLAPPVQKLCAQMARMQEANLPVYYTQGQHELDRNITWMSVHPWPRHVNRLAFKIAGVSLYGIDWLPRGDIQTAFTEVPADTDILVCHQVWKNLMKNIGRPECELADVHNVQYVLTGDFHVNTIEIAENAQGQAIQLVSPGSTCMQDISESPEKYFFVVSQVAPAGFSFEKKSLKTRRFKSYQVTDQDALDTLCAGKFIADIKEMLVVALPPDIQKPLVRVKFDKRLPDAHLRISTAISELAHLFCDAIVDKSRGEEETNRAVAQNDLLTVVADLLSGNPDALKLATALLRAENPAAELEQQFAQQRQQEKPDAIIEA
jgi:hypothetical protein